MRGRRAICAVLATTLTFQGCYMTRVHSGAVETGQMRKFTSFTFFWGMFGDDISALTQHGMARVDTYTNPLMAVFFGLLTLGIVTPQTVRVWSMPEPRPEPRPEPVYYVQPPPAPQQQQQAQSVVVLGNQQYGASAERPCTGCGSGVQSGARFCSACGQAAVPAPRTFCQGCGVRIEGAPECPNCGAR